MAKELRCGDLVPGCDYTARGETEEEVMEKVATHAQQAHGMSVTPELVTKARSAIRDR